MTSTEHPSVTVPFLNLSASHESLQDGILADIAGLIQTGRFTNGPDVDAFEAEWADYCGVSRAVGMGSGLDALRLALLALGIEPGDEVIVPALTFVATYEAVSQAGGRPVPADISPNDFNLFPDAVAAAVGPRTRFVMPVHLYGQLCDVRGLSDVASEKSLMLVEDAAQAHGAERDGVRAGTTGLASGFSFYPGKNLGAFGDAGILVTNDEGVAERARALREHGQRQKYEHAYVGWTARLDTIQALVLRRKLPHLDRWNLDRTRAAAFYASALEGVGDIELPPVPDGSVPVWHLYVIQTHDPSGLGAHLASQGVGTGRHYPTPIHLTEAYAHLGYRRGCFPVAERLADRCLSLPLFPGISDAQLEQTVTSIRSWFDD